MDGVSLKPSFWSHLIGLFALVHAVIQQLSHTYQPLCHHMAKTKYLNIQLQPCGILPLVNQLFKESHFNLTRL